MTNSESLKAIIRAYGSTPTADTNRDLLAHIVRILGGTPSRSDTNDELIAKIAAVAPPIDYGWTVWDTVPSSIADEDGKATKDVYYVLAVAGAPSGTTVAGMIPKGETVVDGGKVTLLAGGVYSDGICAVEVYIGQEWSGTATIVPITGGVAGEATVTTFEPAMGESIWVYVRDDPSPPE